MKIYIGPYKKWWGPYQLAELTKFIGFSENTRDRFGKWLNDTILNTFCNWCHEKKKHTIRIRIDPYDTWSMDHTLAHIILPMLEQLKRTKHGSPYVDDTDVPEALRSSSAPPKKSDWDIDDNHHARWTWVLDEMIWAFGDIVAENDLNVRQRRSEGLRLFGKYFESLWD